MHWWHYCLIKDISRLVRSQISKNTKKKFFCDGCLCYFSSAIILLEHQRNSRGQVCVRLPNVEQTKKDWFGAEVPANILKFNDYGKSMRVPFAIYADFESILQTVDTCAPNSSRSFTSISHVHKPFSFAYYIKCSFDDANSKLVHYREKVCWIYRKRCARYI